MKRVFSNIALSVGLAAFVSAAHADPIFTPILTVNCFGFGVCAPGIPVTQMVETAPGQFTGVMYMLSSTGEFGQGYVIISRSALRSTWKSRSRSARWSEMLS